MVGKRLVYGSDRSARSTRNRPGVQSARRRVAFSLLLSLALVSGGAAALTPSATAEVTEVSPEVGRTAKPPLVIQSNIDYGSVSAECEPTDPTVPPDPPACYLDLYKTDGGRGNKPLVVIIHGGGWIHGEYSSKTLPRITRPARDLARAGYVVLAMDYPGAKDDVPGTTMEEDAVNDVVAWAKANRAQWGINHKKVAFIGGSSGGQLSLLAALKANKKSPGKITMAYSLSGPVDLWKDINALQTGETLPNEEDEGPPGYRNIELYLGCDWELVEPVRPTCTEAQAKAVSPLFYRANNTCPLVRITRSSEEDIDEAEALDQAFAERGCRATDPPVGFEEDPQVLTQQLETDEHGFAQWDVIGVDIIADLDAHLK